MTDRISPSASGYTEPLNVLDEIRWVSTEAARLAREGGDVDRRAAYFARKAHLNAELARIAGDEQGQP